MTYAQHLKTAGQTEPILGKDMIKNAAGGYVFAIDDWKRLRRFLILGCEGGTYYYEDDERKLTLENAEAVIRCAKADGARTVAEIVEVSDKGLAVKNEAAIFALAVVTKVGDAATRKLAFAALPKVCRIGTHLFQFVEAREAIGGGWGRAMRAAVAKWYDRKDLVLQALKFQQRGGWSHRDVLRLAHPVIEGKAPVFAAICKPEKWADVKDKYAEGYVAIQTAPNAADAAKIIAEYDLPREFVPTQFLKEKAIWEALLAHMPLTAMIRNLGNMSKAGLLVPMSNAAKMVSAMLDDEAAIKKARVHPFAVLVAAKTYAQGHGMRGKGEWTVVPQVVDALDGAYNLAFHNVEPTGKRFMLGIDVSGSMSGGFYGGDSTVMSCAEAAAAMAMVIARTEKDYFIGGFSTQFVDLGLTANDTLPTILKKTRDKNFGGTDCAVAINYALKHKMPVDAFMIYTDNETWAGDTHACTAIKQYRKATGLQTKLGVVAFTGTARSIADGADPGSMDFVGMDASLPAAIAAFIKE